MKRIGDIVCKHHKLIILISLLLLIPSLIGIYKTKINYDILVYLPDDIETIKGEKILTDDFKMGAYAIAIIDNMADSDILKLESKIKTIDGVNKVISANDLTGTQIPMEYLPDKVVNKVAKNGSRLIFITFNESTSDDKTLAAVEQLRKMVNKSSKIGGMSTMVLDTKELFNSEMTLYVVVAVILCIIVLMFSLDSYIVPILLILNIGLAILYNMGSNIFLGNISYITKAISSVLQLGVTTDFSIFLYHKYEAEKRKEKDSKKAMSLAIKETLVSVLGSSLTTIAGFLALCTMNLKLGTDIGIVMAKGVIFGLICVVTVFPALLLIFDKYVEKTRHKTFIPQFKYLKNFVLKHYKLIFVLFLILLFPAFKAQTKTENYYKLDESIPDNYGYSMASKALINDYGIVSQEIILVSQKLDNNKLNMMIDEIEKVDGIDLVLSGSKLSKYGFDEDMLSDDIKNIYQTDKYKMVLINSSYDIATDELNDQIIKVNKIVKKYDKKAIVAGEGPLMKDLIETTDQDFKNVNFTSIGVIFILMLLVLKSISLPVLLVSAIEFAIFINMGIPYFKGTQIPFIASVVIGTIQLGATIDYAILMTTKYLSERKNGKDKFESVKLSMDASAPSIFVSGMCFFAATVGVALVSKIDLIGSLCTLISRGAIISMLVVMIIVPSLLIIFDKLIINTTMGFRKGKISMKKLAICLITISLCLVAMPVSALTKEETVYAKINQNGNVKKVSVVNHLINEEKSKYIVDYTDLKNIENTNGVERYKLDGNKLTWSANKKDIYYKGTTNKDLPISLNISYRFNDKVSKVSKMLGKKGRVEIKIQYQNNDKHIVNINGKETIMYTPFVVATSTILDGTTVSNIKVDNGKVISNGQNYLIAGLSAPSLSKSLGIDSLNEMDTVTITYDTNSFELPNIYSAITPKIVDSMDLDKLNNLDSIYSKINLLSNSSKQLVDGSKKVNDGTTTINNGVGNAIDSLKNNKDTIDEKTLELIKNTSSEEAVKKVESKKEEIMNQAIQKVIETEEQTKQIKNSSDYGIDNNTNLIDALKLETHKQINLSEEQITQIYTACNSGASDYCSKVQTIEGYEKQTINQAKQSFYENAMELAKQTAAQTAYNTALEVAKDVSSQTSYVVAQTVFDQVKQQILGKVVISLDELKNGLDTLSEGTKTLKDGMEQFDNQGINQITSIVNNEVKPSIERVKVLKKLSADYNTFTKAADNTNSSTKFVYTIEGKSIKNEKVTKRNKENKKTGFVDRVINLFK